MKKAVHDDDYKKLASDDEEIVALPTGSINNPNSKSLSPQETVNRNPLWRLWKTITEPTTPKLTKQQELKNLAESLFKLETEPQTKKAAVDIAVNIFRHMSSGEDIESSELQQLKENAIHLLNSQSPEAKELNKLAADLLRSEKIVEQKLAMSILAYINPDEYPKFGKELKKSMNDFINLLKPELPIAKKLKNLLIDLFKLETPELEPCQIVVVIHVLLCLISNEDISYTANACVKYFNTHDEPELFSGNKVDRIIQQIRRLANTVCVYGWYHDPI